MMTFLLKNVLPRRSFKGFVKIIAITLSLYVLVDFGFKQNFDFDVNLDRNGIEHQVFKTTKKYVNDEDVNDEDESLEVAQNEVLNFEEGSDGWQDLTTRRLNIFGNKNLGELGAGVDMPKELPEDVKKLYDEGWKNHQFNEYLSNQISLRRELPDVRNDYCKEVETSYSENLPATSVIIIFYNEAWSTLLRTVYSVLDRSPEHLITEIILVDDFSDMDHLKQPLDDYIANLPKVKLLRAEERGGLIKARLLGAAVAKGPVLTFLDSHCECSPGWLEPLLDRIAQNPTNVPWPIIGTISAETFEYYAQRNLHSILVGGFEWSLQFMWISQSVAEEKRKKNPAEPTRSPAMAGGLFSIDKAFFERLGMYDPGFDIWGAENLELSFKTWMCGGVIEVVPCSHVGHIYRKISPYPWRTGVDILKKNSIRLAEVWLDDYKKFYYMKSGSYKGDYGDISDRLKLRQDLQCKSFQWYVENIYPELQIPDNLADGYITAVEFMNQTCLDVALSQDASKPLSTYACHFLGGTQAFEYTKSLMIRKENYCVEYIEDNPTSLQLNYCKNAKNQEWMFRVSSKHLIHKQSGKCLQIDSVSKILLMSDCDEANLYQKWMFEYLNGEKLLNIKR